MNAGQYSLFFLVVGIISYIWGSYEYDRKHAVKQKEDGRVAVSEKRRICDEAVDILGQYGYTPNTARKIVLTAYAAGGWASGYALVEYLFSSKDSSC